MTKTYCSDPRGRKFLSTFAFLMTLVVIFLLNVLRLYVAEKFPQYLPDMSRVKSLPERVILGIMLALLIIYVIFIVILLPMWYKSIKYTVTDKEIISRTGLFSRTYRIMKLSAVQHAALVTMPLSGFTCFNFISIGALGGNLMLMFLSRKDCSEIMDILGAVLDGKTPPQPATLSENDIEEDCPAVSENSLFSSEELIDIVRDFSGYKQLSFTDGSAVQLSFDEIEEGTDKQ